MAGEQSMLDRFWGIFAPPRAPPVPVSRPLPPAPGVPVPKPQFSPDYPDEYADQSSPASTPSMHGVVQNIQLMKELGLGIPPPGARQSDRVQDDRGAPMAGIDDLSRLMVQRPERQTDLHRKFGLGDPRDRPELFAPPPPPLPEGSLAHWVWSAGQAEPEIPVPASNPRRGR